MIGGQRWTMRVRVSECGVVCRFISRSLLSRMWLDDWNKWKWARTRALHSSGQLTQIIIYYGRNSTNSMDGVGAENCKVNFVWNSSSTANNRWIVAVVDDADGIRLHWEENGFTFGSSINRIELRSIWNGAEIYANRSFDVRNHDHTSVWDEMNTHSIDGIIVSYRLLHLHRLVGCLVIIRRGRRGCINRVMLLRGSLPMLAHVGKEGGRGGGRMVANV